MLVKEINYKETSFFSSLFCDYIDNKSELKELYNLYPSIKNFKKQIEKKKVNYNDNNRKKLYDVIKRQYKEVSCSKEFNSTLELIKKKNTFTITTGHQLNLFTGPVYFLYKIITTINLCNDLNKNYPDYNFIPIYWMATEDHDFDEINHFNFKGKRIQWDSNQKGVVGEFKTTGLKKILKEIKEHFPANNYSKELINLFEESYIKFDSLSDATRNFVHVLFKKYNLIIIDANHKDLKSCFKEFIKNEIKDNLIKKSSLPTISKLEKSDYKIQAHSRDVNLFYIEKNKRNRIVKTGNYFKIEGSDKKLTEKNLRDLVDKNPEKFSPNVLFRTMYQEILLPNLCYIGGPAEISYWLQLKNVFDTAKITFPILLSRNSLLLISSKQVRKLKKLDLEVDEMFLDINELSVKKTKEFSEINIDFSELKNNLKNQFDDLITIASKTDISFIGAVKAQEKKQLGGINNLEKKLLSAQKKKFSEKILRIVELRNELFPKNSLQERNTNFSEFYCEYGNKIFDLLHSNIKPLNNRFLVIEIG